MEKLEVIVEQKNGQLDFNYEELKQGAKDFVALYEGAIVDDENLAVAKKEVAGLRKIQKTLNDKKIEVKTEFMKPYTAFENKIKEVMSLFDEPIKLIDGQVKAFDEKAKAEKLEKVKALYEEVIPIDNKPYLTFDRVFKESWTNKSTKMKDIEEALRDASMLCDSQLSNLEMFLQDRPDLIEEARKKYAQTFDMNSVYTWINELKAFEAKKEEAKKAEEVKEEPKEEIKEEVNNDDLFMEQDFELPFSFEEYTYKVIVPEDKEEEFLQAIKDLALNYTKE